MVPDLTSLDLELPLTPDFMVAVFLDIEYIKNGALPEARAVVTSEC